jgi:hypothetical protein
MNRKILIKLCALILIVLTCVVIVSYKQTKATDNQECTSGEKCDQKKAQTDLILLESISKHLLSTTDN